MHKLHTFLKKAGISLLTAFTVFTNTNMGTLIAKAAEPELKEGDQLYEINDGENTYSIRTFTSDESEVLFALRPDNNFSADDQYQAYADDGVDTYLKENDITEEQMAEIRKIISIGYGVEPNDGNYIATQILVWEAIEDKVYDVDENVVANIEEIQARIQRYNTETDLDGYEIVFTGYGEDNSVTLENEGFVDYEAKDVPEGYHVETGDGVLTVWADKDTKEGTLSFEQYGTDTKNLLYSGSEGDYLSLKQEPNVINIQAKFDIPVEENKVEDPEEEEKEESKEETKLEKALKAAKGAKAPAANESVGDVRLIDISDIHVDYLKANTTEMTEGETFQTTNQTLSFDGRLEWQIPNYVDLTNVERVTYQLPKNFVLTELSGDVTYKNNVVGTYEIDGNNILYISYNDDFKSESNRSGWFKFKTEEVAVKTEEQGLVFESGEEYFFKEKEPDPPQPVTPKIGVNKTYHEIKEGVDYSTSNFDYMFKTNYTIEVYTKDGDNHNIFIEDTFHVLSGDVYYDNQTMLYSYTITNNGVTKARGTVQMSQITLPVNNLDQMPAVMKQMALLKGQQSGDNITFFMGYAPNNGYQVIAGLNRSDTRQLTNGNGVLPTILVDHLDSGDVLTINYYLNDWGGNTDKYGSRIKNEVDVVSDENPEAPGTGNSFPNGSGTITLTQHDEVEVFNNAYNLFDKQATSEGDTVHVTITVNEDEDLTRFSGEIIGLVNQTYDTATNVSVEPSADADYYLDKESIVVETSRLVPDSSTGKFKRETIWSSSRDYGSNYYRNINNILPGLLSGSIPLAGFFSSSSNLNDLLRYGGSNVVFAPMITIKYDLKLNPDRVQYSTCSTIEYQGSNTISTNSNYFITPSGQRVPFSKTVNYKNTLIPPHVEKKFDKIYPAMPGSYDTFLAWDINIYVPDSGLTNMVVTDLPSEALQFYDQLNSGNLWIKQDQTVHENPITLTVTTDENGKQKGEIKIDGRVEPGSGNYIHLNLAFKPGDYTLDPNYVADDEGNPLDIRFTNNVDIDADEIITPCVKCPGCDGGDCTKKVETENVINKTYKAHQDNTGDGGDLLITWKIFGDISNYLNDSDEIIFEDFSPTNNLAFDNQTLSGNVVVSNHNFETNKETNTDFSDVGQTVRFSSFFDVTQENGKTVLKVKPQYVSVIKGKRIQFDYVTKATRVNTLSGMTYTNHIDMLVNGTKESDGEDHYSIKAQKDNSFKKEAISVSDFYNEGAAGFPHSSTSNYLLNGLFTSHHPVDPEERSNKNVVVWKMEVDVSKLNIDENTESITISDILPQLGNSGGSNVKQDVFGVAIGEQHTDGTFAAPGYYAPIDDGRLGRVDVNGSNIKIDVDLYPNNGSSPQRLSAIFTKKQGAPSLKSILDRYKVSKLYMYVFADYIPLNNLNGKNETIKVTNTSELFIDSEKVSTALAVHDVELEPSIKKTVVYDKDTAPYAEYTVQLKTNEYINSYGGYHVDYGHMIIEDTPSKNLEILRESVTLELDLNAPEVNTTSPDKVINYSYDEGSGVWKGFSSSLSHNPYLGPSELNISTENGKLSIDLNFTSSLFLSNPFTSPGTTLTIKYKAKVNLAEGETLNEKNEVFYKFENKDAEYETSNYLSGTVLGDAFSKSAFVFTDIFKKDAKTNDALKNAEFRIDKLTLNTERTTITKTETFGTPFVSGDNGHTPTVKLNYDTVYRIVETAVPSGYPEANKVTKYVVFPGHDNIDWENVSVDGIDYIEIIDPTIIDSVNKVSQATIEIANAKETSRKIVLTKKDDKGRILPDAVFSLTGDDGSYAEYKTKDDGTLEIDNLVRGVTYTLAEKEAPQFYEKNENVITFTVSDKGEITSPSISKYHVDFDGGSGTITLDDETGGHINTDVDSGETIGTLPDVEAPEGYHFVGWVDADGNTVDASTVVDQNKYVTAKYEHDVNSVTFHIDNGTMSYRENLNVTEFTRIVPTGNTLQGLPSTIVPDGYAVTGWFDEDNNGVTADTVVTDDMVITAKVDSFILQPGNEFASNLNAGIKNVVFGSTDDYSGIIEGVTGVNVDADNKGTIKAYTVGDTMYVLSDNTIYFNPDSSQMFLNSSCVLNSIVFDNIDTSLTTTMNSMFEGQTALAGLDLTSFDTSNVTSMSFMFKNCKALADLDLNSFDTGNVTSMNQMFLNNYKITSLDLSSFDTSSVTTMSQMFKGCTRLVDIDLSSFNTSNVTRMDQMFFNLKAIESLDVSNFDTSSVTHMQSMFYGCEGLTSLDLRNFNTQNVTAMASMFGGCSALETLDISSMDTANNPSRTNMFTGTTTLSTIHLGENWTAVSDSGFSTDTWTQIPSIVSKSGTDLMTNYTSADAGKWILGTLNFLYNGSTLNSKLRQYSPNIIIFGTNADYASKISDSATEITVSDSENIKCYYQYDNQRGGIIYILSDDTIFLPANCSRMFASMNSLQQVSFENVDASLVTDMSDMFYNDSSFISAVGFENLDLSSLTNTSYMFASDKSLNNLDISSIDTSKLKTYSNMFAFAKGQVIVKSDADKEFYRTKARGTSLTYTIK